MLNNIHILLQRIQVLQTELQAIKGVGGEEKAAADTEIQLRQARRDLFALLASPSTLSLLFDPDALEFCKRLLEEYLKQKPVSKWFILLAQIKAQLDVVYKLHFLTGKVVEDILKKYQSREIFLTGETMQQVKKQVKGVVREVELFFSKLNSSPPPQEGRNMNLGALPGGSEELQPFSDTAETLFTGLSVIEKVEAYFRAYFQYLESKGYSVTEIHEMVRDVLFEIRQEKGFRVKGLFVDKERREGHVDDIVVMLDKGIGDVFHGILADRRMQLAVENAVEAAIRYTDEDPNCDVNLHD